MKNSILLLTSLFLLIYSCTKKDIVVIEEDNIDTTGVARVNLTDVSYRNGSIYLEWDSVTKQNFDRAYLFIDGHDIELSKEIINSQSYNDTYGLPKPNINGNSFEKMNYKITLENYTSATESNILSVQIPDFIIDDIKLIDVDRIKVTYPEYPLYNNCEHLNMFVYSQYVTSVDPLGGELIIEGSPLIFGDDEPYYLRTEAIREGETTFLQWISQPFIVGKKFADQDNYCIDFIYDEVNDVFYGLKIVGEYPPHDVYVQKLNPLDLSTIESKYITTASWIYGEFIINHFTNNLILDLENVSYTIDISTLTITKEWRAENFITDIDNALTYYRNEVLVINEYLDNKVSIFNSETHDLIYSETSNDGNFFISDDGHYFYFNDNIYSINNGIIDFITTTDSGISNHYVNSLDFIINESKCVYSYQGGIPVIYDFNSGVKTELTDFIDIDQVQYDAVTETLMLGQYHQPGCKSYVFLYDIPNSKIKKLRVQDDHYSRIYRYLDGVLIFSGGRYLKGYMDN